MNHSEKSSTLEQQPIEHQLLLEWWENLDQDRGDRAALRRAATVEQVMFSPGFHRLWRKLRGTRWSRPDSIALIAALAARVKKLDSSNSFAAQLGSPPPGRKKVALSGLRFRRLLQASQHNELLQACSRAIAICDGRVNLISLAKDVYWWTDQTKRDWAFDYYDANPSAD